jgi:hypothetical protein
MMRDFLTFRRMITPVIIELLFWVGVVVCVVTGLTMLSGTPLVIPGMGETKSEANDMQKLAGLALLVLGPLVCRVYAEFMILLFRMNDTLTDIKNGLAKPGSLGSGLDTPEKRAV